MAYSEVGKARLKVYAALYAVNVIVLALAARVNQFQAFFFMADLFPLGLSIATLVFLSLTLLLDFSLVNPFTSRPPFELGFLSVLTILWLAFNAFSTSRWQHVPYSCASAATSGQQDWCRNLHTLKTFVWVEWVILFFTTAFTARFAVREHMRGNTHVWRTALSRYAARYNTTTQTSGLGRDSGFSFSAGTGAGISSADPTYAFTQRSAAFEGENGYGHTRHTSGAGTGASVAARLGGSAHYRTQSQAQASFVDFGESGFAPVRA